MLLLMTCAFTLLAGKADAGSAVAGADVLKIPIDARGWGIGMAYSAVADDVGAIAYNPAGLRAGGIREARFTYQRLIEGTSFSSLLLAFPLGRWATVGGMLLHRSVPTIQNYDPGCTFCPFTGDVAGVDISDTVVGLYASFRFSHLLPAVDLTSPLSFGLGIKQVTMRIAQFKAQATAVDFGFLIHGGLVSWIWNLPFSLFVDREQCRAALVFQNMGGGYTFPGTIEAEADALPQTIRLGHAIVVLEDASNSIVFSYEDASYIGVSTDQKTPGGTITARESLNVAGAGVEYWRLSKMGVRLGYVVPWGKGADNYAGSRGLAIGVSFRHFTEWLTYQIDIAYRPVALGSEQQDAGAVSLSLRF